MLRICAKASGGKFPDNLLTKTVLDLIQDSSTGEFQKTLNADNRITVSHYKEETKPILRRCLKGLAFVRKYRREGTWQYMGRDVKLGDAGSEVCSWMIPDSQIRRTVYGDLRITDISTTAESKPHPSSSK